MISNFICVCHVNDINLTQILLGSTGKTKHAHETKRPKEDGHKQKSSDQPWMDMNLETSAFMCIEQQ